MDDDEREQAAAALRSVLAAVERGELDAGPLAVAHLSGALAALDGLNRHTAMAPMEPLV